MSPEDRPRIGLAAKCPDGVSGVAGSQSGHSFVARYTPEDWKHHAGERAERHCAIPTAGFATLRQSRRPDRILPGNKVAGAMYRARQPCFARALSTRFPRSRSAKRTAEADGTETTHKWSLNAARAVPETSRSFSFLLPGDWPSQVGQSPGGSNPHLVGHPSCPTLASMGPMLLGSSNGCSRS